MIEKCENCKKDVIPIEKRYECEDENIIDYHCPICHRRLKTRFIEK